MNRGGWCGYGMAGGCFTHVVLHISKNSHQEHVTEPRRLLKYVLDAVTLSFQSVQVVIYE